MPQTEPNIPVLAAGHVQSLNCTTDFASELLCRWEVDSTTNCAKEFRLLYQKNYSEKKNLKCVPENGKDSSRGTRSNCTCTIRNEYFTSATEFELVLEANGTVIQNTTVIPADLILPRAVTNVSIEKTEQKTFILRWKWNYEPGFLLSKEPVTYELEYWIKQHPEQTLFHNIPNPEGSRYPFSASLLKPGHDYVTRLHYKFDNYHESRLWSPWSDVYELRTGDPEGTLEEKLQVVIPVSCMLVVALIVTSYLCFSKAKRVWWDEIPSPAKSTLVGEKFSWWWKMISSDEIKTPFHIPQRSHVGKQLSYKNPPSQRAADCSEQKEAAKSCLHQNTGGESSREECKVVLTPETPSVAPCLVICKCPAKTDAPSLQEESGTQPWENSASSLSGHIPHDDALASMFMELLDCGTGVHDVKIPGPAIEEHKMTWDCKSVNSSPQTLKAQQSCSTSLAISDSFPSKAPQSKHKCSMDSKKSVRSEESFESGYQSSNTDAPSPQAESPPDSLHQTQFPFSSETQPGSLISNQKPLNTLTCEIAKDRMNNPAYKSFGDLVPQSSGFCNPAYKSFRDLVPQSSGSDGLAYKSFGDFVPQSSGSDDPAYKSFGDLVSQSPGSDSPAYKNFGDLVPQSSWSDGPAYKSFRDLMSQSPGSDGLAYKSFRDLVSQSPGSDGLAYKSFRDLVSQSSGSDGLAYKSFGDVVPQSFVSDSPAYKSFGDLVPQSFGSDGLAYKSFGDLVPQSFGSDGLAYKSFGDLLPQSFVSDGLAYKSFGSLVSQSSGSDDLAYKSFGSLVSQSPGSDELAYKSFGSLVSQSPGFNGLTLGEADAYGCWGQ
uniref:Fibronectin type-III domain-containing protein n=1 Tax=Sphenodon punctatus TaxID=8508 RepID=A0A8D0GZB7_SPHPU